MTEAIDMPAAAADRASGRPTVLVVDDRPNLVRLLSKTLGGDARVLTASGGGEAARLLERERVGAVLCDLKMEGLDGIEVLRACKRLQPSAEFVMMTAHASVPTAIEAMRLGAYDYLTKPFQPDEARAVVLRALERAGADAELQGIHEGDEVLPGVVGRSPAMRELGELVGRIAPTDATALLLGETGTGKERVARAVHALSPRAGARFVAVNCAAIPAELLESELFGHARGAFTGASRDRAGLFEEAHEGTLFLDEIGDMPLPLQAKLTRVLEERTIRRVGESRERTVDVRLVTATHRDLAAMAKAGAFREDLWYRLNVAAIRLPPLRERGGDIELLAGRFLADLGAGGGRLEGFTPAALETLRAFAWPGNVRQLRAVVERASILARAERIDVGDLSPEVHGTSGDAAIDDLSEMPWQQAMDVARDRAAIHYLRAVLQRHGGRVPDAASHAGVERESFYRLLRRYGVRPEEGGC